MATLDHRPYIVSGEKPESFVGLSRGGFGNPFDVTTKSRDPLADDISDSIVLALRKENMVAEKVLVRPSVSVPEALRALQRGRADRYILVVLSKWKGDSMMQVAFGYDFEVTVLDNQGNTLVQRKYKDKENLGDADLSNPGGERRIKNRFRSLIPEVFGTEEMKKALMTE